MKQKVLYITTVWPEPQSSAAGLRNETMIHAIQKAGWDLVLASPSKVNEHFERYRQKGISVFPIALNDSEFDQWVHLLEPTVVIYDRFVTEEQFSARIRRAGVQCLHILDAQDLHFLRLSRETAIRAGASVEDVANLNLIWDEDRVLRELASICRSDFTFVLSDFEKDLLIREFEIPRKRVVQSGFAYTKKDRADLSWEAREDFVFIGNYRHAPNKDGARWLVQKIWPMIKKSLPDANLFLYGAYPDKEVIQLQDRKNGVYVKGWAPDQFAALSGARVNLAPLRYGAGIKGKIVDGWVTGTPAVTTSIGAEGLLNERREFGGEIANNPHDFALKAVALFSDEAMWQAARQRSAEYLKTRANSLVIDSIINTIDSGLNSKNWLSKVLDREETRSTEYFSRWIEEKNKRNTQSHQNV